jgi:hypothetical protein
MGTLPVTGNLGGLRLRRRRVKVSERGVIGLLGAFRFPQKVTAIPANRPVDPVSLAAERARRLEGVVHQGFVAVRTTLGSVFVPLTTGCTV